MLEELVQWPAGTLAGIRAGGEIPGSSTGPDVEETEAPLIVGAVDVALSTVNAAIANLPADDHPKFAEYAQAVLADLRRLVNRSAVVVQRYGGTVDKFTGDGIMAVFGAPVALEDHAVRACFAVLGIQHEAVQLAAEIQRRDGTAFGLRVGLNSGQVIAGDIGSGAMGYTAVGEHVGLAQRMESAAAPGGVMLSESTARLVQHAAVLGEPETVRIKA